MSKNQEEEIKELGARCFRSPCINGRNRGTAAANVDSGRGSV